MIQKRIITGNITWKPVGEKTGSIASLQGKIVPRIGKCTGIMEKANGIRLYNNPQNPFIGEKTRIIASLQSVKETLSEQETQHKETSEKTTDNS